MGELPAESTLSRRNGGTIQTPGNTEENVALWVAVRAGFELMVPAAFLTLGNV
jgi:hypothetical protein